ncbi:MAG: choice-of-anchor L domain-containing protein [Bacteroidales bacterium]|nr:choice-of-anchor L domain-containing protein [Bacteroidales bacterium]
MTKRLILLFLLAGNYAMAQLNINTSLNANQLMQNFIGGGVTVFNVVYTGGNASKATFTNGNNTNLGLSEGIILCSGNATNIANPATFFMSNNLNQAGDATLNSINNGTSTFDAAVLEFDFIPVCDSVKFKYVFGSEEYPHSICSQYNDVFAFFITGPNPAGGNYANHNIALIPGTNLLVSVNSVNLGVPGPGLSAAGCLSLGYSNYYVDNLGLGGTTIAFGGFTTPLTARCKVVKDSVYHMKIAVADGQNAIYDSGVFLEANSFSSNVLTVNTFYPDTVLGQNAMEGCSEAIVSFIAPANVTSPTTITYTIGGSATNGVDYNTVGNSVTIPAGQDSAGLVIHPLADENTEGAETIILNITYDCLNIIDTIYIIDKVSLQVTSGSDMSVCSGNSLVLGAAATGGVAPVSYAWSGSAGTSDSVLITPSATTTYTVTVTDHCATTATDNVQVTVTPYPVLTVASDAADICSGTPAGISASGATDYTWIPGNLSGPAITVSPATTTTYTVTGSAGANCTSSATLTIHVTHIDISASSTAESCGKADGTATVNVAGNCGGNYSYVWNTIPVENTPVIAGLVAGDYTVTVSCGGCSNTATVTIPHYAGPEASFTANPPEVSLANSTVHFTDNSSGTIISRQWELGDGTASTLASFSHSYDKTGSFLVSLTVTDENGCTGNTTHTVVVREACTLFIPNAFTPNDDGCNDFFTPCGMNIDADHFQMIILNRYGLKVYETRTWNGSTCQGWDGTLNNNGNIEKAVTGVYAYRIFAGNKIDGFKTYTGGLTLIQ